MKKQRVYSFMVIGLVLNLLTLLPASWAVIWFSDGSVTSAVERRLASDGGLRSDLIKVEANEGTVKLSGSVDNILARDRAIEIAQSTMGVRSVIDMVEVDVIKREDNQIREDIVDAFEADPAVDPLEIDVEITEGAVTLTGYVDSHAGKSLAEQVAKGVKGVKSIESKIEVVYRSERSDDEIKADIEGQLRSNVLIDAGLITVRVENGNVKLTGKVGSPHERLRVKWNAWVSGIKSVDINELEVDWSRRDEMRRVGFNVAPPDEEIKDAIIDAFSYDPRVNLFQIDVEVVNGLVTLTGTVGNLRAVQAAQEDSVNTFGVVEVKRNLLIQPEMGAEDSELMSRASEALMRDPYLESFRLRLSVLNGEVILSGTVDSYFDKRRAGNVVSRIEGVADVQNNLEVKYYDESIDAKIKENIEDQLSWSLLTNSKDILVSVQEGSATLTGSVDSLCESKMVAEIALASGATQVINNLKVKRVARQ